MIKPIRLWGARQNNLKGVEITIPNGSFTVVCGPSGSGKSSLAFETLYAEGQRRYIESLSNYSKQFLNKAPKPDVEGIDNIPPAIAIEQKNSVKTSRSTVGTTTEIIDYLRILFAKAGEALCPHHDIPLHVDSPSLGAERIVNTFSNQRGFIMAPVPSEGRLIEPKSLLKVLLSEGYQRIYIPKAEPLKKPSKKAKASKKSTRAKSKKVAAISDESWPGQRWVSAAVEPGGYTTEALGEIVELNSPELVRKGLPTTDFYIVVDRMVFREEDQGRLVDSLNQAFQASVRFSKANPIAQAIALTTEGHRLLLSEHLSCSVCGFHLPPLTSAFFSFNSPLGACPTCNGFGNLLTLDEQKVVPNPELSLAQGAISPFAMPSGTYDRRQLKAFCKKHHIDVHTPWKDLPAEHRRMIWEGTDEFYGVKGLFEYLETKKYKMHVRVFISRFKSPFPCSTCGGTRLKAETQWVRIQGKTIGQLGSLSLKDLYEFFVKLELKPEAREICEEPLRQVRDRLRFLLNVGVGYLTLDRATRTLSGGEYQRLHLANQLGMGLSQTLYVLDEPTVGLHPRDSDRLVSVLKDLQGLGNTLVVVEHDHDVIRNASHVIEMGPGSGYLGGEVIFAGSSKEFMESSDSLTSRYLRPGGHWLPPRDARPVNIEDYKFILELGDCHGNNLKHVNLRLPLNRLVTVTGVSGSGKSSLITHTLYPAVARALSVDFIPAHPHEHIKGTQFIKNVVLVDQGPIGKTARSNPLTYLKIFDSIRTIMASSHEARAAGYTPGSFSLNVDGGRCPVCKGLGYEIVDMVFMDDIEVKCDACDGKRYRPELLEIQYKGKNIAEILDMTVQEAMDFYVAYPQIRKPLSLLKEVGLEYLRLGQSANSLSGGESQRLKIAKELSGAGQKATLYILDEPTTGLHFREVHLLLKVLHKLVDAGNSVVLIEHNLEVVRHSDFVIDIGPEAGVDGGQIIAQGSPENLIQSGKGHTSQYLRDYENFIAAEKNP